MLKVTFADYKSRSCTKWNPPSWNPRGICFGWGWNRFVLTFHGQASFAWNWAMLRCQCRIVDLAERALRYAEHRWGPHSGGLGNRDPETTGSVVVSYLYFMHMAYLLSREGRCDHSGGLRVAYVSHAIEIEACEWLRLVLDSLKLGLGVSRAVAWVWRFVARCC